MLRPKTSVVLNEALEQGCQFALNRVLDYVGKDLVGKDLDYDSRGSIIDQMMTEIRNAIDEWFILTDDNVE